MTSIDGMGTPIPASLGAHSTGWITSLLLHASLAFGAFVFTQQITLAPQPTPFKWNVAMVEPTPPATTNTAAVSSAESAASPENQLPSTPVPRKSFPSSLPSNRTSLTVKPARAIPPPTSSPSPTATSVATPAVTVPANTTAAAPSEPAAQERSVVRTVEPASQVVNAESAVVPTSQLHEEREPQTHESTALATLPPEVSYQSSVTDPTPSTTPNASVKPEAASEQQQIAMASVPSSARADYGWLKDTILRRVEELKRYPPEARLDRAEGKVVLKVVIRGDGSVEDVEVYQSSGYRSLDHAAVELLRLAAPFQLPRPLGKSQMTVKIPMSYRLEQ